MKKSCIALILGGFGLASGTALSQPAPAEPPAELKALAESCAAHKFETIVSIDGRRGSRVKICGKEGQSDADWLVTLKDAVRKTGANEALAQPVREQIIAALEAEIARLATEAAPPPVTDVAVALPARPVAVPEAAPQYSKVPALPAPKPRTTAAIAAAAAAPVVRPRLTVRCALPRESFAACARLERETQLLIRADEDLAVGTSLRFLRGGDARAELELGSLRKGESLREKLPGRVCSGVLRGKVQVQILSKSQVAETLGPYALYCGS